jgi:DNA-binding CsgD family transcriptional regulator
VSGGTPAPRSASKRALEAALATLGTAGGREEAVVQFLSLLPGGPAAIVVEGETGQGKTTLWRAVVSAARARGYQTLSSRPAASEVALSYTGLADLLGTVEDSLFEQIPRPQARALEVCLWRTEPDEVSPDPRAVATGVLSLLALMTRAGPVLIALDDARWLDAATAGVLSFVVRRLGSLSVGIVVSVQAPEETAVPFGLEQAFGAGRLRRYRLGPLGLADVRGLLERELGLRAHGSLLRRLYRVCGGNPLFALELARSALGEDDMLAPEGTMELSPDLAGLVSARMGTLSPRCRSVLAVVAAAATPTIDLLEEAGPAGLVADAITEAVDAGVLVVERGRARFTHSLMASACYSSLTPRSRRELHGHLARLVADGEQRARHLALATVRPRADVALELERAAVATRRRGSPAVASGLAERAAELTPRGNGPDRERRELQALRYLIETGARGRADALASALLAELGPGRARVEAMCLLADTRRRSEDIFGGIELLRRALADAGDDPLMQARVHRDLAFFYLLAMVPAAVSEHAEAAGRHAEVAGAKGMSAQAKALHAIASCLRGEGLDAAALRSAHDATGPDDKLAIDYRPATWLAIMCKYVGDLGTARALLAAEHELVLAEGLEVGLGGLLWQMSELETLAGDLSRASAYADEAVEVATMTLSEHERALALSARAGVRLAEGDFEGARADGVESLAVAEQTGFGLAVGTANALLAELDQCSGQPEAAHTRLQPLIETALAIGIGEPGLLRTVPVAAEALVAVERPRDADLLLQPYEEKACQLGRTSALGLAGRVRGLALAADGQLKVAIETLEEAAALSVRSGYILDAARTQLWLGRVRRRARDRRGAKSSFEAAKAAFEAAGAAGWAAQVANELSHIGLRQAPEGLSATEARVADLAAAGTTNAEIARRLGYSRRAVEANLARAYAKLGAASRGDLRRALGAAGRSGQ